ncbi:hypothetical protein SLE2022_405680 [Rubroshorea leprosula]
MLAAGCRPATPPPCRSAGSRSAAADEMREHHARRRGEALGLRLIRSRDRPRRDRQLRRGERGGGGEAAPVEIGERRRVRIDEVRHAVAQPHRPREPRAVRRGAEQPGLGRAAPRRQRVAQDRKGVIGGQAAVGPLVEIGQQFGKRGGEILRAEPALPVLAERERGAPVAARRAPDAEIDPPGSDRGEQSERLGDLERRIMRKHHPARSDADARGGHRHRRDQRLGRGPRECGRGMVLRQPVAMIAEAIGGAREVDRVAHRLPRVRAGDDGRLIEDGEAHRVDVGRPRGQGRARRPPPAARLPDTELRLRAPPAPVERGRAGQGGSDERDRHRDAARSRCRFRRRRAAPRRGQPADARFRRCRARSARRGRRRRRARSRPPAPPRRRRRPVRAGARRRREELATALAELLDGDVLAEMNDWVRDEVLEALDPAQVAALATELDTDDAVAIIEDMDEDEQRAVLRALDPDDRAAIEEALSYPEESAGRLMQRDLVAVPEHWRVGDVLAYLQRGGEAQATDFWEVFVVDERHHPVGTCKLSWLLTSPAGIPLGDVMQREQTLIPVDMDQEEVALRFQKYEIRADLGRRGGRIGAARRHDHRRRRRAHHPGGGGRGRARALRRRRRRHQRADPLHRADAARLAGGEPRHRDGGGLRRQPVRCRDREVRGARRADGHRLGHGRQRRHADAGGGGARARHQPAHLVQHRAHDLARVPHRGGQRPVARPADRRGIVSDLLARRSRRGVRRGDPHQQSHGGAGGRADPDRAGARARRSRRLVRRVS